MADTNGTKGTATNIGYIEAQGYSDSNSVGGYTPGTDFIYDRADFFRFNAYQRGTYQLIVSTPNTSFVGEVDAQLTKADSSALLESAYITSSAKTASFEFGNYLANTDYVLSIYRFIFDSSPASQKTQVDYNFTIKPINYYPDEPIVYDLKSSYRQDESISLKELYVGDLDGWGDVKELKMQIVDSAGKFIKETSSSSFTQWSGGTTYAQTSLNQSLKDVAPGNYTVRFEAFDRKSSFSDPVKRQITITAADPLTTITDFKKDPTKYMGSIRDYDGDNLGSSNSWKLLGDVDIQGDGDLESILVNPAIGRFASVGAINGNVDFTKYGLNGDTRVVGIYIDPTLKNSPQNIGGPFDSQKRFQNDLRIDNLKLLAAGDYNKDGFQDLYFKLGDGSAVLRALMFKDGNIQYANYQSKSDLAAFMTANNVSPSIWGGWI